MKNSLTLLLLLGGFLFIIPRADGADYYWIGNEGIWTDMSHWTSRDDGVADNAYMDIGPPGVDDNVYFNSFSFSLDDQTVYLAAGNNNCYNMIWTGVTNNPTLAFPPTAARLNVYYSLVLDDNMSVDYPDGADLDLGSIWMLNDGIDGGTAASISTRGKMIPNLYLAGVGGVYSLTETLNVEGKIEISAGTFQSGAPVDFTFEVNTDEFIVDGAGVSLKIDRMVITATSLFSIVDLNILTTVTTTMDDEFISEITTNKFVITAANAVNFGALTIDGTDGLLDGSDHDLIFFGDVILEAESTNTLLGSHTYEESLYFNEGGSIVLLEAESTQTLSSESFLLSTASSCFGYITLRSTEEGTAATIAKTGGDDQQIMNFYIQDVHVNSNRVFTANNSIDRGNTTGWTINTAAPVDYYWIGGDGLWSDGSHWTGGNPGCIPTAVDNVFFDEASFTQESQVVTVDLPEIYFNDMTWTDPNGGGRDFPVFSIPSGKIYVGGSLELAPTMSLSIDAPGSTTFYFVSDDSDPGNTITAEDDDKNGFDLANIVFTGAGKWTLNGNLYASQTITFKNGIFDTGKDHNVESTTISVNGSSVELILNDSELFSTIFEVISVGDLVADGSNIYTEQFNITPQPEPLFFNELLLRGDEGILDGEDLTFLDVVLSNDVKSTVLGSHTYTRLLQFDKPGMTVEFEPGTTQRIADLEARGNSCGEMILVKTTGDDGQQVTFEATDGDITVSNILLQDNIGSPDMAFEAESSQNLGNNVGWVFSSAASTRYFYWRGGTGDWNDADNWMYASNAMATPNKTGCIPTASDNVIFDAESFTEAGQTVTLDGAQQYCRTMTWYSDVLGVPTMHFSDGSSLNIFGSLILTQDIYMTVSYEDVETAFVNFRAENANPPGNTGYNITTFQHVLPNVTFEGPDGYWVLSGGIQVENTIEVLLGHFNTNGFSVDAGQFLVNGADAYLTLGNSILSISELFQISSINTFEAGTSSIRTNVLTVVPTLTFNEVQMVDNGDPFIDLDPDLDTEINGDGLIFNTLILTGGNNNYVHGSHTINQLLNLNYNLDLLDLPTDIIVRFIFDPGSTQTFSAESDIISTSDFLIPPVNPLSQLTTGSDDGALANFSKPGGGAVCLTHISIININASPASLVFGYDPSTAGVSPDADALGWVSCALLPVECTDFAAAVKDDNSVELYWTTAQELNNSGFELQRSLDGRRFEPIAWIDGAGTTPEPQKYTYVDRRTSGLEEAYYRLRQVDFDGTSAFACTVVAVNFRHTGAGPVQVFPNPASKQIQVRWYGAKSGSTLIRLFDQSGRLLLDQQWNTLEGTNQRTLPIADLPKGIYELQLVDANGNTQGVRLVKE